MMEFIASGLHTLFSFVIILSAIVFVHEFGHYFIARLCGVKIEVFSIGFGREIFGFNDKAGTRWKFSIAPVGGYVKMYGDEGAASTPDTSAIDAMTEDQRKVSFHHKPLWQKALVVAAGPAANFILAITIMTAFLYMGGMASTEPVVGEVMPNTPAAEAGLKSGDRIMAVDGASVTVFGDIPNLIATNLGTPVKLDVKRESEMLHLTITPISFDDVDALGNPVKHPLIGIKSQEMQIQNLSFAQAVWISTTRTYDMCTMSLKFLGQMILGERSTNELKGPIGIAKMSGQVTQSGDSLGQTGRMILWFIAMLSVNLGFVNLLPIPMLDGGHLVYYALEGMRGRPVAKKFQEFGFRIGFYMIMGLMAFTLFNDIRQFLL